MVLLANEVDEKALISNPFLDLPILTAARGFLADRELLQQPGNQGNTGAVLLRLQWGEINLAQCKDVLGKMSVFWGGVGCVKTILDQQSAGHLDFDIGEGAQPDSRIDCTCFLRSCREPLDTALTEGKDLRDVELIKQWAANAWRRQRPNPSGPSSPRPRINSPRSTVPLLPVDHNNLQYGSVGKEGPIGDSPEDAAIGITGELVFCQENVML